MQIVEWQQRWQEVVAAGGEIRMTPKTLPTSFYSDRFPRRCYREWEVNQAITEIRQRNHDYLASLFADNEPDGLAAD